jgi:hypothetical protein
MIDGPYTGWKPTPDDWYRIKFGTVLYVDKDGLLSPVEINRGAHQKLRTNNGYNQDTSSPTSESHQQTYPMGGPMGNDDPGTLRQMLGMGGPAGFGVIQPEDLPPTDFFVNSPSFSDSSTTSSPSGFNGPGGMNTANGINGISGGMNGTRIAGGDSSSMLPIELMIYNDLMTDIGGTARFLGQEFQDSVLFGPTPTSSPAPVGQQPGQGPVPQSPSTMYGWVFFLQSPSPAVDPHDCDRFWERTLYDNFLNHISKQAM